MSTEFESRIAPAEPDHEEFQELCALAGTDALDAGERERLGIHLAQCAACRQLSEQYVLVAQEGMPLLAAEFAEGYSEAAAAPDFDLASVKAGVLARASASRPDESRVPPRGPRARKWRLLPAFGLGLAAAALLVTVGVVAYQKGRNSVEPVVAHSAQLSSQLQDVSAEKTALDAELTAESRRESQLFRKGEEAETTIATLEDKIAALTSSAQSADQTKSALTQQVATLTASRSALNAQLLEARQNYQSVQAELASRRGQRQQDALHDASLEVEVGDLQHRLTEAESRVKDDSQYLASDRDIRELMGARQLYIADVVDVDQNGDRRQPFGRVFYTKGKKLIFYAFDLDQQPGVRQASTFQAWAREGADNARPVSLGIFYVDSESNRRWALKTSDPAVLAEIDSVFVTVEPKGGSRKPTGKPLLYAYLRTEAPNHP